jgi:hypothetical protein
MTTFRTFTDHEYEQAPLPALTETPESNLEVCTSLEDAKREMQESINFAAEFSIREAWLRASNLDHQDLPGGYPTLADITGRLWARISSDDQALLLMDIQAIYTLASQHIARLLLWDGETAFIAAFAQFDDDPFRVIGQPLLPQESEACSI